MRQLFGDRPSYRQSVAACPAIAAELNHRLPELAAELTGVTVSLIRPGQPDFSCPLPGRLKVGRRRADEPPPPAVIDVARGRRLVVAELMLAHISRSHLQLEVVAKNRLLVQHTSTRGYVDCVPGGRLTQGDSCEVPVPCQLNLRGPVLRIEVSK